MFLLSAISWTSVALVAVGSALETVEVPGVVIDHVPAAERVYVGSPGLAVLPDGTYVASHDYFGPGSTKDTTVVFQSNDQGATWKQIAELKGQWWSTLFVHEGDLYLMGTSREYGFTVIRRSTDGGRTWTEPADVKSGLLLSDGKYHCAPVPVLVHDGRIWRAMEDAMGPGGWGSHFRAFMMSAPVESDLLNADSWTCSKRLGRDPKWLDGKFGGWLEGNAVATPEGEILDILRVDVPAGTPEVAAFVHIDKTGKKASFDPDRDLHPFPGGAKKFTIRRDAKTGLYWSLVNWMPPPHAHEKPGRTRNTLALVCSNDLKQWDVRSVLIYHPDVDRHGYQYVEWLFDGDDLLVAVRTAHDEAGGQAHNQHDANYLTFHRVEDFRDRSMRDAPQAFHDAMAGADEQD